MNKLTVSIFLVAVVGGGFFLKNYLDQKEIQDLRLPIISNLVDPESAQFRDEIRIGKSVLCGEVNAKNRMGGYTGFKKFVRTQEFFHVEGTDLSRFSSKDGKSTEDVIAGLDAKISIQELQIKNKEAGLPYTLSKSEVEELIQKKLFDKTWNENCKVN